MEAINKHRPAFRLAADPGVPVALPDRQCALLRFHALMRRLDRWLQAPVRTTRDARGHTVWLMDGVGYRVDLKAKAVAAPAGRGCCASRLPGSGDAGWRRSRAH